MTVLAPGEAHIKATPRLNTIKGIIKKPLGEYSASRFFSYPAYISTLAVATISNAVGSDVDKAPFLRCVLM